MQKNHRITVGWTAFFVTDLQRVDEDCFHHYLAAHVVRITGPLRSITSNSEYINTRPGPLKRNARIRTTSLFRLFSGFSLPLQAGASRRFLVSKVTVTLRMSR